MVHYGENEVWITPDAWLGTACVVVRKSPAHVFPLPMRLPQGEIWDVSAERWAQSDRLTAAGDVRLILWEVAPLDEAMLPTDMEASTDTPLPLPFLAHRFVVPPEASTEPLPLEDVIQGLWAYPSFLLGASASASSLPGLVRLRHDPAWRRTILLFTIRYVLDKPLPRRAP